MRVRVALKAFDRRQAAAAGIGAPRHQWRVLERVPHCVGGGLPPSQRRAVRPVAPAQDGRNHRYRAGRQTLKWQLAEAIPRSRSSFE